MAEYILAFCNFITNNCDMYYFQNQDLKMYFLLYLFGLF